jgi:nicotinate-nucleotide adenylyltransferase
MSFLSAPSPHSADLWANRTVGLLGGSFNPAHEGHRHASLVAMKHLRLDAVWWLVSPQNPLKPARGMAPLARRLETARAAADHPKIFATDIEHALGTRYTADTIATLKRHFSRTRFVWLMGLDNLHQIHLWKRWEDIFKAVPVCVIDREISGGRLRSCPALARFRPLILHAPLNAESATRLRRQKVRTKGDRA